jgi:DNA polymerase-3 subunit delta
VKLTGAKVDRFLTAPDPGILAVLLYGPDSGLVRERAELLMRHVLDNPNDPFRASVLDASQLLDDPGKLDDNLKMICMFGGRRVVWLRAATEKLAKTVEAGLNADPRDVLMVIEAGDLPPRNALRRLGESNPAIATIACYIDDEPTLARHIAGELRDAGICFDQDIPQMLASQLIGNRQLMRRAMEVLRLYVGEAGKLTLDDARTAVGDSAEGSADDVVMAAFTGDGQSADRRFLNGISKGMSEIAVVRAFQRHLMRLRQVQNDMVSGVNAKEAVEKLHPPVFFKLRDAVARQADRLSPAQVDRWISEAVAIEAAMKQTGAQPALLLSRLVLSTAAISRKAYSHRQ